MKKKYDVLIIGAGIAGICASIAAAREGLNVMILEKERKPGGVITNSLVMPMMTFHSEKRQVINGIAQEIIDILVENKASVGHITDPIGFVPTITPVVSENMANIFEKILNHENVEISYGVEILSVKRTDKTVISVLCNSDNTEAEYGASVFIDATGDGSFSIMAGNEFIEGDGSRQNVQPMSLIFHVGGINKNRIIDNILSNRDNFVLRKSHDIETLLRNYLAVSGFFKEATKMKKYGISFKRDRLLFFQVPFTEDQIAMNTNRYGGFANDVETVSKNKAAAIRDTERVIRFLNDEIPGFENAQLLKLADKMGIRETTHVTGKYIYKISDLINARKFEDSISVGAYPIDYHSPYSGKLESKKLAYPGEYFIPYPCLLPKNIDNVILAGRAVSCDHMSFSAIRTSPLSASTGQAAGMAASLALKENKLPGEINVENLRKKLSENGVIVQ